jgi:hypothetical protein
MAYLDAFTANAFLKDSQGRLVFVASRRKRQAYLVTPEIASKIGRFVRGAFAFMMLGAIVSAIVFQLWVTAVVITAMVLTYSGVAAPHNALA